MFIQTSKFDGKSKILVAEKVKKKVLKNLSGPRPLCVICTNTIVVIKVAQQWEHEI